MKKFILSCWNPVMGNKHKPLSNMDMASQHYIMQVLAWMWSMIFSLSFFSIYQFGIVWLGHLLWISGVVMTVAIFKEAEKNQLVPVRSNGRSTGPLCLWNLEKEA